LKIFNIFYLTRLGHPVSILFKPSLGVKFHDLLKIAKNTHIEKEAANDSTSSSLTVVTMKNCDSFSIFRKKSRHFLADSEQKIKRRGLMILPIIAYNVFENFFIDRSAADVNSYVFSLVVSLK
jgi:hypothetical protein